MIQSLSMPCAVFGRALFELHLPLMLTGLAALGPSQTRSVPLAPGRAVADTVAATPRCYSVRLAAGQYALFSLDQPTGDLALELFAPSGHSVLRHDAFEFGIEHFSFIPDTSGQYRACVSAVGRPAQPLRFSLQVDPPRPPLPEDDARVRAERAASEAKQAAAHAGAADLRRALDLNRQALALLETLGDATARIATQLKIGDNLNALSEYAAARAVYADVIESCPSGQMRLLAEALANSAWAAYRMGDPESARGGFERSLDLFQQLGLPSPIASIHNNLGLLWLRTGEFQLALDAFLAALPVMHRTDPHLEGIVLSNIALAYRSLGEYHRAEDYLGRSLPLLAADRTGRGKALMNLGRLHTLEGDLSGAAPLLRQAAALLKDSPDGVARGDIANNLGQLLYRQGDFHGSLERLAEAQTIYRPVHNALGLVNSLHFSGLAMESLGEPDPALVAFRESLELRRSAHLVDDVAADLLEIARIQRRAGDPTAARASLDDAIQIGDELRVRIAAPDLRAEWFASRQPVYGELIDLLVDLHNHGGPAQLLERALETEERSRSRSLLDGLAERRDRLFGAIAPELLSQEREVVRALSFQSQQLAQLPAPPEAAARRGALWLEVDRLEAEYQRLEGAIEARNPRRAEIAASAPLRLPEIRDLLDANTVLLEFTLGDERSYLWVASSHDLFCFLLPGRRVIETLARTVTSLAGSRAVRIRQPAEERRFHDAAADLGRILFAQAAPLIRHRRLLLAPDGVLNELPFAVLPSPEDPTAPLGITHELVNVPSASVVGTLRRHPQTRAAGPLRIALFADPIFSGDPRLPPGRRGPDWLASLPFSSQEADWIENAAHGAQVLRQTGFAFSKPALTQPQVESADILHLATHAQVDETHPELSGIYFSQADAGGNARNGLLGLNEIYSLNLPVQLVVLSGCRTGLGKAVGGDGLVGLARAFFFAGTERVLVSLWRISDEGTALFMQQFYNRLLSNGFAPPAALRAAREALYRQPRWRDPSYWSGFVLEGEWKPLATDGTVP